MFCSNCLLLLLTRPRISNFLHFRKCGGYHGTAHRSKFNSCSATFQLPEKETALVLLKVPRVKSRQKALLKTSTRRDTRCLDQCTCPFRMCHIEFEALWSLVLPFKKKVRRTIWTKTMHKSKDRYPSSHSRDK